MKISYKSSKNAESGDIEELQYFRIGKQKINIGNSFIPLGTYESSDIEKIWTIDLTYGGDNEIKSTHGYYIYNIDERLPKGEAQIFDAYVLSVPIILGNTIIDYKQRNEPLCFNLGKTSRLVAHITRDVSNKKVKDNNGEEYNRSTHKIDGKIINSTGKTRRVCIKDRVGTSFVSEMDEKYKKKGSYIERMLDVKPGTTNFSMWYKIIS